MANRKIELKWRCSSCEHLNLGRHTACQNCGDPKDASEKYEMPSNTAAAASVTDPKLLRMANAGANWRCAYCGSDQRRDDGRCDKCGASQKEGTPVKPAAPAQGAPLPHGVTRDVFPPVDPRRSYEEWKARHEGASAPVRWLGMPRWAWFFLVGVVLVGGVWKLMQPRVLHVRAKGVTWERLVHVERKSLYHREGFQEARPADAFNILSLGQRFHHYEKVLDGYDTEYYTEQVACGQDCTSIPQTCSEVCTDDGNGFASCHDSCSGGGESCTTRYCSESRSRQVPRYRDEPRTAMWYSWDAWEWHRHRTARAAGRTLEMRWPAPEEILLGQNLGPGEDEREQREGHYLVLFEDEDHRELHYETRDYRELAVYSVGTKYRMREVSRGSTAIQPIPEAG